MEKIKIVYIPSNTDGGVFYYRTLTPMTQLAKQFPDKYSVVITNDLQKAWDELKQSRILIIHNCLYDDKMQFMVWNLVTEAKKIRVVTILDLDDYWNYGEEHPMNMISIQNKFHIKNAINLNLFDCVTTTTERFKEAIGEYSKNVVVLKNGISRDDQQFSMKKNPSSRIRFGLTGGASHTNDLKQLFNEEEGLFDYLDKDVMDKIQLVLCGFNLEGKKIVYDQEGNKVEKELSMDEKWWVQLERQITKDYSIVSPEYKQVLLKYDQDADKEYFAGLNGQNGFDEPYRRVWSTSIKDFEYGKIYQDIDVLLVPLNDTKFNQMKSELKFVESGFTGTAMIASQVIPYTDCGVGYKNCLFVKDLSPKGWAFRVTEIVNQPELMKKIAENLSVKVLDENDLEKISKKRNNLFSSLISKKKS